MSTLSAKHLLTVNNVEFMTAMPRGARLLLPEISWADYEYLLGEIKDGSPLRLHYDQGKLEIMTLSPQHESLKVLFGHLVFVLAEELEMKLIGLGSTTFKLPEAARGTEPDDCFYIRRADAIEGKSSLDLRIDPGPDLVVEIDLTHPSLNKMPIYASLDVTEVWRYDGEQMHLYLLTQGQYKEIVKSDLFPFLTAAKLTDFLTESNFRNVIPAIRAFRNWVKSHLAEPII